MPIPILVYIPEITNMRNKTLLKKLGNLFWLVLPLFLLAFFGKYILVSGSNIEVAADEKIVDMMEAQNAKFTWRGGGVVTFWFDDAWSSQYDTAFPVIEEAKYKAALAIPTKLVNFDAYMNWHQIRKVHYKGWQVMSHSRTHNCDLVDGNIDQIKDEILGGKSDLEYLAGINSDLYVAPCGRTSPLADQVVKDNFAFQRIVEPGLNPIPVRNRYEIKVKEVSVSHGTTAEEVKEWLAEAKATRSWLVLMFHQVDNGGDEHSINPEVLEDIVYEVQKSGLQVALPYQVLNIK